VDLNIVQTADGQFIEIQGTAERQPFSADALQRMLDLAQMGLKEIIARQNEVLQTY
jgi:ribonuclease PH